MFNIENATNFLFCMANAFRNTNLFIFCNTNTTAMSFFFSCVRFLEHAMCFVCSGVSENLSASVFRAKELVLVTAVLIRRSKCVGCAGSQPEDRDNTLLEIVGKTKHTTLTQCGNKKANVS